MATTKMNQMIDLRKQLETNGVDLLPHPIKDTIQQFMAAEVDATCGAPHGAPNEDRVDSRKGFTERAWDTRLGTIDLELPTLRQKT